MKSLFFYFDDPDLAGTDPALADAISDMLTGSDRAVAILGAALVDAQLRASLLKKFDGKAYVETALGGREFLASFSARITVTRMLGLFSDRLANDLNIIRKIRNDFAHEPIALSFATPTIADRCKNLTVPDLNIVPLGEQPSDERSFIAVEPRELRRDDARFRYVATCAFFTVIAAANARHATPIDIKIANN